jgi:hypothetical protein
LQNQQTAPIPATGKKCVIEQWYRTTVPQQTSLKLLEQVGIRTTSQFSAKSQQGSPTGAGTSQCRTGHSIVAASTVAEHKTAKHKALTRKDQSITARLA